MNIDSPAPLPATFAVTIAFAVGTALVTLALYAMSEMAGQQFAFAHGVTSWLQIGIAVAAIGAFAGLFVDALRYLANAFWRKNLRFGLKIKKLLQKNLAD